eukprot:TRINITY_DN10531_c0_g1_i2.p1 TRINITY_DN10531_c0_g1~~TRINITY_DN10531_c0_g1_i2.p1  ORF type:complete len:161 (+),score=3.94 TRINITY_DN10531_c0_g1_i2:135-617(+)
MSDPNQYPPQGYPQQYPPQQYPPQQYPPQQGYPAQPYPQQQAYPPQQYAYQPQPAPVVINMQSTQMQQQAVGGYPTTVIAQAPLYSYDTALWLSVAMSCLLGVHGVHRCYLDDVGMGILQGFTCGGCWIWTLIDWCNMRSLVDDAIVRRGGVVATTIITG